MRCPRRDSDHFHHSFSLPPDLFSKARRIQNHHSIGIAPGPAQFNGLDPAAGSNNRDLLAWGTNAKPAECRFIHDSFVIDYPA
jgi:hypothetical protein